MLDVGLYTGECAGAREGELCRPVSWDRNSEHEKKDVVHIRSRFRARWSELGPVCELRFRLYINHGFSWWFGTVQQPQDQK